MTNTDSLLYMNKTLFKENIIFLSVNNKNDYKILEEVTYVDLQSNREFIDYKHIVY